MKFEEKKEIVLKNWYKTDCKSPESITVKEAYSLGFNRACKLLRKENERLQKLVEVLQEEKKSLESMIMLQNTMRNPFTPYTNCCASINYPNGFNPQANWCKNLE